MKVLLIMPDAHMHKLKIGRYVRSMREMPLSLAALAALTPADAGIDVRLVDGSVEPIPLDADADLVGISLLTGCALEGYRIARHFRDRGIPVVLGGAHATVLPGEAALHADAVVVGRAEESWPRLLDDFRHGRLQKVYMHADGIGAVGYCFPTPRTDLHRRDRYMAGNTVFASLGCSRACDFCIAPIIWPRPIRRPVADVIRDVKRIDGRYFAFNDVNLVDDREYARELFRALVPLRKQWGGLATVDIAVDDELLALMAESGCRYLLFGFESGRPETLKQIRKGFNIPIDYREVMIRMRAHRISVQGCFVFGFDHDEKNVFADTVDFVNELQIDIPRYALYTPYPGTPLFGRLLAEKRILSFNWNDYDTMHVVVQPKHMTPEELFDGFKWAYRETFSIGSILRRTGLRGINSLINLTGNLAYKIFVRRLYGEARFAEPYSLDAPGQCPAEGYFVTGLAREELCRA